MAYQFRPGQSVGKRARTIVRGQIDKAVAELRDSSDLHTAVHEARKRLKKCRALLRLMRGGLGKAYSVEDRCFREAGKTLSALREAGALVETFDLLVRSVHAPAEPGLLAPVRERLVERRDRIAAEHDVLYRPVDEVARTLRAARRRIERWPALPSAPDVLFAGYRRTYRDGRKEFDQACRDGDADAYHEWRKRVKEHLYHTRLLRPVWPAVMQPREDELSLLAERLGDHHNLAVFRQMLLDDRAALSVDGPVLAAAAARLQRDLEHRARLLGDRLYAEKPKAIARRMAAYWQAAEREGAMPFASADIVAAADRSE